MEGKSWSQCSDTVNMCYIHVNNPRCYQTYLNCLVNEQLAFCKERREVFLADFLVQGVSVKCIFNYECSSNHAFRWSFPSLPFLSVSCSYLFQSDKHLHEWFLIAEDMLITPWWSPVFSYLLCVQEKGIQCMYKCM